LIERPNNVAANPVVTQIDVIRLAEVVSRSRITQIGGFPRRGISATHIQTPIPTYRDGSGEKSEIKPVLHIRRLAGSNIGVNARAIVVMQGLFFYNFLLLRLQIESRQ
jgi:hypothetical protein